MNTDDILNQEQLSSQESQEDSIESIQDQNTEASTNDLELLPTFKGAFALLVQAALLFGGVILLFHFVYINFFPAISLSSSIALLTLIAVTGIAFILLISSALVIPNFIWQQFLEHSDTGKKLIKTLEAKFGNQSQHRSFKFILCLLLALAFPVAITYILLFLYYWFLESYFQSPIIVLLGIFISITGLSLFIYGAIINGFKTSKYPGASALNIISYAIYSALSILIFIVFLPFPVLINIFFQSAYSIPDKQLSPITWTFISSVIVFFLNVIQLANLSNFSDNKSGQIKRIASQIGFGFVLFVIITLLSRSPFLIPQGVLRMYELADISNADLVFKADGCKTLQAMNVKFIPVNNDTCLLSQVTILSRVGNGYYICLDDISTCHSEKSQRFYVSNELVQTYTVSTDVVPVEFTLTDVFDSSGTRKKVEVALSSKSQETINNVSVFLDYRANDGTLKRRVALANAEKQFIFSLSPGESKLNDPNESLHTNKPVENDQAIENRVTKPIKNDKVTKDQSIQLNQEKNTELSNLLNDVSTWCNVELYIGSRKPDFKTTRIVRYEQ